jgi:hypothetical protein
MVEIEIADARNSDRLDRLTKFNLEKDAHEQFKGELHSSFSMSTRTLGNDEFNQSQHIQPVIRYDIDASGDQMRMSLNLRRSESAESLDTDGDRPTHTEIAEALDAAGENLLPRGGEVQMTLELIDKVLKFENVLDDLDNLLFACSFIETILLAFFFIFSLRRPKQLYFWAMHTPHLLHAFQGLLLHSKLPRSWKIVELIRPEAGAEEDRAQNLKEFDASFSTKVLQYAIEHHQVYGTILKTYTKLTFLCFICDQADFIWQAVRSRTDGSHFSEMLILAFCFIFQMINLAYPLWVMHTVWKFPQEMQRNMRLALFGFTNDMKV